jgi:tRNA threonylcarbamoyladenosine biosynthesis protein TsaE
MLAIVVLTISWRSVTAARTLTSSSEEQTGQIGRDLAATLSPGDVVLLHGDLGAGKTAFVKGLAAGLGIPPDEVSSPTFTLIQEYRGGRLRLVHVDLYRLNDPREVEDLGLDEIAAGGVLAVEWAEKLPRSLMPSRGVVVRLMHRDGDARTIEIGDAAAQPLASYSDR